MAYRLLVVAGENEVLRTIPEQIGWDNIDVKLIESPNDALWEVRMAPPEVIIADMQLPEMSGLDLAEILPSFDAATQFILWNRDADDHETRKHAETLDIYRYLAGAITSEELHTLVQAAVARSVEVSQAAAEATAAEERAAEERAARAEEERAARQHAPSEPEPDEPPPPPPAPAERPSRTSLSSRADRLVARTREAVSGRQAEPPAPTATAPSTSPHRQRNLVLTAENLNPIRSIMSQLSQELGPQCIMLTDRAGMVLVEVGNTDSLPTMILLPLLSTSFSTAGEVARQLGEQDATTLYIHEGINYDLYCFDIAQRFLLVLVFNKKVASSKIGAVWVNTKRCIRDLQEALS